MNQTGPSAPNEATDRELPLEVIKSSTSSTARPSRRRRIPRYFFLLFIPLLLFTGGFVGIYVQPPALRAFLRITGLKPGGGTSSPIAVPIEEAAPDTALDKTSIRSVVALGRLVPEGKVITIAPPYGSGDARIEEIKVEIGSRVERGDTLAILDNRSSLESALASAEADLALQKSSLAQTRLTITSSFEEAQAALQRAKAGQQLALREYKRIKSLQAQSAVSASEVDQASSAYSQAQQDVAKAEATLSRFDSTQIEQQPDVIVAIRKTESAMATLNRAKRDLTRSIVTAPVTGTILDIHARPGEKPNAQGILDIGNVQRMTAEMEVYQSEIGFVAVGQHAELTAEPLQEPLYGLVSEIGFSVERQTIIRDDPAANVDARVIKVTVHLDVDSSQRASRLTNLEVTGRIAVEESP